MAKPGSDAAGHLTARARDLSRARMSDEEALRAAEMLEIANGLRCTGCGKRIGRGFNFISFAVRDQKPVMKLAACAREDCDRATVCRAGATYVEQVEYVWLDDAGLDAPAAKAIVEQNEALERRLAAQGNGAEKAP